MSLASVSTPQPQPQPQPRPRGVRSAKVRILAIVAAASVVIAGAVTAGAVTGKVRAAAATAHTITYDKYSLMIDGRRTMIWSGEFHPFRLPSRICGGTSCRR
jgi:hypothetical protein